MDNTTARPGYLTPTTSPIDQTALENVLQEMVVGVTGLRPDLVRPRWQPNPPSRPKLKETWAAVGVKEYQGSTSYKEHGDDSTTIVTLTDFELLASFYGPDALGKATQLRDGLVVDQNRAALRKHGMAIVHIGNPRNVPEQKKGKWIPRIDLPLNIQWETRQTFGVRNIASADGTIVTDTGLTTKFSQEVGE